MLKVGDKAPSFTLKSDAGADVHLKDFSGRPLVVYFYPRDNTPGCTREAQAFTKARQQIEKLGAAVVGISKDSVASHCTFRDKYKLKVPLLSDPDLSVHEAFGAYGEKVMYGKKVTGTIRSTFVIGADGKIARVFPSVKVDGHAEKVVEVLHELSPPRAKPRETPPAAKIAKHAKTAKKKTKPS